ncbi:MAG: hypothetical protein R3E55_05075 [Burkholderiaceae bacterium]
MPTWAAHAYALWGEPLYPVGFSHFAYVNPDAPKGGDLRLVSNVRTSTFDKYNPFTMRGAAPAYLGELMFDSLLTGSLDETATGYVCSPRMDIGSGARRSVELGLREIRCIVC